MTSKWTTGCPILSPFIARRAAPGALQPIPKTTPRRKTHRRWRSIDYLGGNRAAEMLDAAPQSPATAYSPGSMPTKPAFDVVVVGASIAGCTAARLFALAGARVALV